MMGRSAVLRNHEDLIAHSIVLVSGHHGESVVQRQPEHQRVIIDANGGEPGKPVQAIVFPEWLVIDSDGNKLAY